MELYSSRKTAIALNGKRDVQVSILGFLLELVIFRVCIGMHSVFFFLYFPLLFVPVLIDTKRWTIIHLSC